MLWGSYRNHTEAAREQTIAQRDFYERLRALGCTPGRTGQSRFWKGVGIGVTPNGPDADVGDIEPRNVGVTRRPSAVTASGGVILGNGADICREREVSTDRCDTNDVEIGKNGLTTPHEEDFTDSAVTGVTVSQTSNQEAGGKRSKDTPR